MVIQELRRPGHMKYSMTDRMSWTVMLLANGIWVAEKIEVPPETIITTASLSSLVVRSMSGICDVNIRLPSWVFNVTDIFFMRPWRRLVVSG